MNTSALAPRIDSSEDLLTKMTPDDYEELKQFVQRETRKRLFNMGMNIEELNASKNKQIKSHFRYIIEKVNQNWEMQILTSYYTKKAVFDVVLQNALIVDDDSFLNQIEEARVYGCAPEDIPNYLNINYHISKNAFDRKITEFQNYYASYHKDKQNKIEQALKSTHRLERKHSNGTINIEAYKEAKQSMVREPYRDKEKELYYNLRK